jgi:AbrB family looped-hinge helix DNA binding protein
MSTPVRAKVTPSGRISLPAEFRRALGLQQGGDVVVTLDGHAITIRTIDDVVGRAQALTRKLLGDGREATVEGFLEQRRRDAEREG